MDYPKCPVCGKSAYPAQAWMHKDCKADPVNTSDKSVNTTVNTSKSDRHKPGYMREYMAKRRSK